MNKLLLTTLLVLCPYLAMGQSNQKTTRKAPLIGISCSHPGRSSSTQMTYTESVIQAGGTPILISITTDSLVLTDIANRLDGIILIGGGDIHEGTEKALPSFLRENICTCLTILLVLCRYFSILCATNPDCHVITATRFYT